MFNRLIQWLLAGPAWWLKSWCVCLLAAFTFSCAPAVWMFREIELPPAYELKSNDPLADTSLLTVPEHPGDRSHGAKLTPRLIGAYAIVLTKRLELHPYWPATVGGMLVLLAAVMTGHRVSGVPGDRDRGLGLFAGLTVAGLYTINDCFAMNHGAKPFDGVALGMIGLALLALEIPWLLGTFAMLACWTDERAVVAIGFIALIEYLRPKPLAIADTRVRQPMSRVYVALGSAVGVYAVSRLIISSIAGWQSQDTTMLADDIAGAITYSQMAAWTALEGAWLLFIAAIWITWRSDERHKSWMLIIAAVTVIASCWIVRDISRAAAYGYPLLFALIGCMAHGRYLKRETLRTLTGYAAAISLLASNVEIITSIAFTPLPTTPIVVWLSMFAQ